MATFDWTVAERPSAAVVDAVTDVADVDSFELDPLYASLDPDALDALFTRTETPPVEGEVTFPFGDHLVVVKANGRGYVYE